MSAPPRQVESDAPRGTLTVRWQDGRVDELAHAMLRAACPCADCRALRRAGGAVRAPAHVRLAGIEPVGHYALNLVFDDGHARGIYPFALLAQLATAPA